MDVTARVELKVALDGSLVASQRGGSLTIMPRTYAFLNVSFGSQVPNQASTGCLR